MTETPLTLDTNLKALFDRWPAAIPVFLRRRMICVGCSMSVFDTLRDAVENYGLDGALFLAEVRAAVESSPEPSAPAEA